MGFELAPETALRYLRDRGVVSASCAGESRALGGGVSNRVVMAETDEGCFLLKQPRANLAVPADWPADVERIHNEVAAARAYGDALADVAGAHAPAVRDEDREAHVAVFACAPEGAGTWKRELLAGTVDSGVARTTGRILGAVHAATARDEALRGTFESDRPLHQLRVDPYHRTVASRHPDVAAAIDREIERLTGVSRTLVHGDYSPKNVLLAGDGDDRDVWIIDFEVAHWGDPAFDVAFVLNHLCIKSVYNADRQEAYLEATAAFWRAYAAVGFDVESEVVRELGILLLARVDGKSPVEYVTDDAVADVLRGIAKRTIRGEAETLSGVRDLIVEESGDL